VIARPSWLPSEVELTEAQLEKLHRFETEFEAVYADLEALTETDPEEAGAILELINAEHERQMSIIERRITEAQRLRGIT
jgi:hypothetical protein